MKILSTVDFSTASESILRFTRTYAEKMNAEVFLVHTEPEKPDDEADSTPEAIRLKKDAKALERAGINVTPLFLQGHACETILDQAIELGADLIIIGAHGHSGNSCKVPVGHVSECILLKAKIPVLVVPTV
jgi:nucleotide-binding universal stress UspA family protein